ncbi:MAG: TolC family protein [Muribaculum sp.]|nr:TolC family protein [Muribaculum sp.]
MKFKYVTLAMMLAVTSGSSYAITLHEAADAILGRNGDRLLTELYRQSKDAETLSIANAPDPEIDGDYMVAPAGVDNRWGLGVSYALEWPGAYGARRSMGEAMRNANAAEAEAAIRAKRSEIINELENYLYAEMRLGVMKNVLATSDSIQAIAERSHRGGQISRLDLCKIAIERGRMESVISGIEAEKVSSEGRLAAMNGGQTCVSLLESIDKKWENVSLMPIEKYLSEALKNPYILKDMSEYHVADKNVSVAKAERLPGFTLGYAHEFEDGMHFNGASLGISIPLFASRHKVKAAEAARAAAEYKITADTDKLEAGIKSLYNEILALDKAMEAPAAVFNSTDYTDLLLKAYKGGELSLAVYLSELSWFYEAHLEYMELQYQRAAKTNQLSMLCK